MISNKIIAKEFFMELVYLWVESYKNIEKQGFNFSPRFRCEYNEKTNELNIVDKDETGEFYPKNFFGDNINITAIVGENGTGKSSVLNAILNATEDYFPENTNFILVFSNEKNEYYTSNFEIETKITKSPDNNYKKSLVAYQNRGNNDKQILFSDINQYNEESTKQAFRGYRKIDVSKDIIVRLLVLEIGKINPSFKLSSFMYLPNKISIRLKRKEELIGQNIGFFPTYREKIQNIFSDITDLEHQILFIEGGKNDIKERKILRNKDVLKSKLIEKDPKYKTIYIDLSEVLKEKEFDISKLTDDIKDKYIREESYFDYLDFDLIDKEDRRYNDLSHGEQMLFGQLLNLYFYCTLNEDLIFLFDEPEIALHPRWQKNYINEFYTLLMKMERNYHFIFSSHSPFLLSDLPKQNVIFLEKDEKTGNCINATNKVDLNPFGANIHTLLSHGFFMKDGLMGEFAKSKINEVINFLNGNKSLITTNDEAQNLINIIGEPVIKKQLQKMLDSKRLSKIDEIDLIKNQMELLSKRLEEIENAKN